MMMRMMIAVIIIVIIIITILSTYLAQQQSRMPILLPSLTINTHSHALTRHTGKTTGNIVPSEESRYCFTLSKHASKPSTIILLTLRSHLLLFSYVTLLFLSTFLSLLFFSRMGEIKKRNRTRKRRKKKD